MRKTEKEHLAIASIPCQEWGTVYDPEAALIKGTVFPDLNKPFFKADSMEEKPAWTGGAGDFGKDSQQKERESLLKKIYEVSFIVNDLTLYLDTHGEDREALDLFAKNNGERARLLADFAAKYYPLTQACMADRGCGEKNFCWADGPMPWEGACI